MHAPPHKTIRASPECSNQSREAPVLIVLECCDLLDISFRTSFRSHGFDPSFPTHHPLPILLMKPLPQAQTRVHRDTAENASQHARPTSATSNPLAALPTGGIIEPPAAHGFRTSLPLQAKGALGRSEGARGFPGSSRRWLPPTQLF